MMKLKHRKRGERYSAYLCPHCNGELIEFLDGYYRHSITIAPPFLTTPDGEVRISRIKLDMLRMMLIAYPNAVRKDSLYNLLHEDNESSSVLSVHMSVLRQRLAPLPIEIKTLWGEGYCLVLPNHYLTAKESPSVTHPNT